MGKRVVINPVTRISGFMEIEAYIENNKVVEAKTEGLLFRGFEKMLVGRSPFDAVYFTQRICGICSTAHSMASTLALESSMNITPTEQGRYSNRGWRMDRNNNRQAGYRKPHSDN